MGTSKGLFFPKGFSQVVKGQGTAPGNYPANVGVRAPLPSSLTQDRLLARVTDLLDSDSCRLDA